MKKYHNKYAIQFTGNTKLGKPSKHFADDIQ